MRAASAAVAATLVLALHAQVTTSQYDNARTGANLNESTLTPQNVNAATFGRVFRLSVDGDVYAQPLYLRGVDIAGKGRHNAVFIATEHDSVYAFDAAGQPLEPLWHVSFINAAAHITTLEAREVRCPFISPEVGITSTPVIDPATGTLYVLVRTKEPGPDGTLRVFQRLHALDVTSGAERKGSPVLIRASVPGKAGGFLRLVDAPTDFNALIENPRAALLLANGKVWLGWASSCDVGPYHGWVMAYDAGTLRQVAAFNTSPDDTQSGIWAGDAGFAADAAGNIFVSTGNGKFDAASGGRDYGDTVLKLGLGSTGIVVRDYFTPFDEAKLNDQDNDLGSGGVVLLPDQPGAHRHALLAAGKGALVYEIDRDRMGRFHAGSNAHAITTVPLAGGVFGAPAYANGKVYYLASDDVLKQFTLQNGNLSTQPASHSGKRFIDPGATPTVSANGTSGGIVWAIETKGWQSSDRLAVLHAWDANDVARELYNSDQQSSRDQAGRCLRFTIPTVMDGRVYVPAKREVDVYGLLAPAPRQRKSR